jgi:hypothetical protein
MCQAPDRTPSPAGAAVLFQRIRLAAERVCEVPGTRNLGQLVQVKAATTAVNILKTRSAAKMSAYVNTAGDAGTYWSSREPPQRSQISANIFIWPASVTGVKPSICCVRIIMTRCQWRRRS